MTSVGVRQHTQDVRVCSSEHTGRLGLSVFVCVCPLAHTGRSWLSISTHINTLVLGLSTLTLPADCSDDFGPRGLCVQYTQDVRGCLPAHTVLPWLSVCVRMCPSVSVSTQRMSVAVHQYTYQHVVHTGRPWVSASTHRTSVGVRQYTYQHVVHVGSPWVSVSTHRTSMCVRQHTQDVRVCPSAHIGRSGLSVCVCVCPSTHTGGLWLSISTHISTLVLGLSTLTLPVNCSGDFGPRGLSGQYTQDVRGCPPAHTGHPWLSVCVRVCSYVSVSTHRTSMAVHQYTYQHVVHIGRPWVSASAHSTSVAVCGCPSAHTRRLWLSVCDRVCLWLSASTHRTFVAVRGCPTSVCVHVCPSAHTGRPWLSISTHISTLALAVDYLGDFGPRGLSVQYTQDIRGCPPAHTGRPWVSVSTHISTLVLGLSTLTLPVDCSGDFGPHGLSVQYTQDVRGCPSAHTGRPCVSVSTHRTSVCVRQHTQDVCGCPSVHISARCTHRTSVGVRQHTQDICGCPCVSVCVRLCPSAHIGHPWLSISTHINTLVLGLSMLALPVDCLGDLDPRGLSFQYTQDIRACPPACTARLWLSVSASTHMTFVAVRGSSSAHTGPVCVRQHTQEVRVCPCVPVSTHMTSVAVHQYIYQHAGPWTQHACPSRGLTSVCVCQHTQDIRDCPCVSVSTHITSVAVHQYTYQHIVHTGRPWVSASTHRTSVAVRGCPSVYISARWSFDLARWPFSWTVWVILAHIGCLFSTQRTSVGVRQHTHDVRGCPWLSVSTHRTFVAVRVCPCVSVSVRQNTQDVRGCPSVHISARWSLDSARWPFPWTVWVILAHVGCMFNTYRKSAGVCQHKHDVCGCPWLSISTHMTSVAVRVCPCVSVVVRQHTQDVRGCSWLSVSTHTHTGSPWVSVSTHRTSVFVPSTHTGRPWLSMCVCVCPSAHTGRPWLSISTHISTFVLGLSTLALLVDCLGDFGPRGLSVQYTQDVRGCPPAHIGRLWMSHTQDVLWLSVAVRQHTHDVQGCPCMFVCVSGCPPAYTGRSWLSVDVSQHTHDFRVCPSAHTGRMWLSISTHISTLVLGLSMLALPEDCSGDFGPRGLSVQYTQDIRGCPSAQTGPHIGRPWLSISTHISTLVLGLSMLALPGDRLGDFGPRGLSVQYTQDVRGCPPAHTGRLGLSVAVCQLTQDVRDCPCVSVCVRPHTQDVRGCPCVSMCVRQHTQDVRGCSSVYISARWSLDLARWHFSWTVWVILAHVGCLFSTQRMSVGVHQHTHDVRACPCYLSAHTGRPWLSVCVRVCPSVNTGRPWLSISTQIGTLVLGLSMLTLPVDCSGDFGLRGLSVQYTQDVRGGPPAHTGCLWLYVAVRQHTQDVHGCPCVFMCVYGCPPAYTGSYTGRPWLSNSTHISTLVLGLSMLALPEDCSGDFGRRGLSVQYTQDIRGCPSAHTGRPWVSVSTHRTSVAVRVCPCVSISTHRTSVAVHQYTYHHVGPWTQHDGPSWGLTSVCVRQHTQDVWGCPWMSISTHRTSMIVRVCPSAWAIYSVNTGRPWVSVSSQHTQDVCGCPSAHTGRPCVSVSTHRTFGAVRVCPCVSVSTHRTFVAVHQYTYKHVVHTGCPWVSASTHWTSVAVRVCPSVTVSTHRRSVSVHQFTFQHVVHKGRLWESASTHRTSVAVCQHTQVVRDCPCVSVSTHRMSVGVRQHTQDVRVCPSAHTGRPWLSISTHRTSMIVRVCPSAHTGRPWVSVSTHRTFVCVRQHTHDVRGCPCVSVCVHQHTQDVRGCSSVYISTRWSLHLARWPFSWTVWVILAHVGSLFSTLRTSVGVRQHTQDVRGCPWLSVSTHRTSVAVHQYTYQHVVPWTQHTQDILGCMFSTNRTSVGVRQHTQDIRGCPCVFVSVRVCPSAHTGRPWLSISTHISTLVLRLSTLALPGDCLGDFGPRGLSVQYTQDVCGCPPAHTGRPGLSDVCVCPSAHTRRLWLSMCVPVCPSALTGCSWLSMARTSVCVRQHTQDVRVCLSAHTGRPWLSISTHISTLVLGLNMLALPVDGHSGLSVCVRVCPSAHIGRPWLSISTHISTLVLGLSTLTLPVDCSSDFGPRGLSIQYTQDVRGCPSAVSTHRTCVGVRQHTQDVRLYPSAHTGRPGLSVCVRVCPSAHIGRLWLSISTHISMLVLGLSTLTLPVDCSGDFGPRGMSGQYTQDVCGCPCVSVCDRQHTQDVRVCPSVHISARLFLDSARWPSPWTVWVILAHVGCLFSTHKMSVGVRQDTQNVCGCPSVSVCVCGCPPAQTGRSWLSMAVRQHTQDVYVCPSAHTRRVCVSVCVRQHTQEVRGCPSIHILARCTHMTSVGVRQHTQDVRGCPCVSVCVRQYTQDVRGFPSVHISALHTGRPWVSVNTHRTFVCVHQLTEDVRGCPCVSVSTHRMSVTVHQYTYQHVGPWTQHVDPSRGLFGTSEAVRVCLSVCVSTHRTSVAIHQYTYQDVVHRTSVGVRQHTHDVCGCLCVSVCVRQHTQDVRGYPRLSISTHRTSVCVRQHTQDVRVCLSAHTGRLWLSISTHISTLVLGLNMLALPVDGRPWVFICTHMTSVAVRVCPCVSVCTHMMYVAVHQYTYQHVGRWTQHANPSRGLVGQHTQDVCGCPSAHTGRPCVSVSTHRTFGAVRVCPCVSVSTHRTFVAVHQYTYKHVVHTGCPWVSASTHWTSVAVRVCPSVTVSTHRRSVSVHQFTFQHVVHKGRLWESASTHRTSVAVCQHTQVVRDCPCVSVSTHRMSVGVRQHTQDVRVCPSAHTGRPWLSISTHRTSMIVRVCPSAHTGRPWVSVSTHRTFVCVRQHTHDVRGCPCVSVCVHQHTQDVRGCSSVYISTRWSLHLARWPFSWTVWVILAHVGSLFSTLRTSVGVRQHTQDVRGCPWLSVSTHRTSVAVHQYTYQHVVPWTQHTQDILGCMFSTNRTSVGVRQHTQDIRGCPCVFVSVRVCPSAHTGRPWLSISTHISTLVLRLSTLALPGDCLGDFGPRGLSVQYTQDVCGCPPAHTGRPGLSDVCVCPSAHTRRLWLSMCVPVCPSALTGCSWLSMARTSVCVRQHTQDVRVCLSAHTGRPWLSISTHISTLVLGLNMLALPVDGHSGLSVCVRVCPSAHIGRPWLSISTHISTLVLGLSTLTLPVDCSSDFGPRGLSIQYTQDVRGCPSAVSTHRTCVGVRQHTQDVRLYPSAHTGRPGLSVCVRVCPSAHIGRLWLSISTHISMLVLGLSTLTLPVDCSGDFGPRGMSGQYTQDVCGCPCVSVCDRQHTQDVRVCPSVHISARLFLDSARWPSPWTVWVILAHVGCLFSTHKMSVGVRQDTQNVCGCPSVSVCVCGCPPAQTGRSWLSMAVRQHTQDVYVCPSAHTRRVCVSVCVRQHTQEVRGCPSIHILARCTHMTSVGVRQHTQDVRGCPCVSVCVRQYTQDVRGFPSVHISARWFLDSAPWPFSWTVRLTEDVRGCPCVSVSTHRMSVTVHQYTYQHVGPWTQHVDPSRGLFGTSEAVRVCLSVCVSTHRTSVAIHQYTYQDVVHRTSVGRSWLSEAVYQHTQDVRVCPSAHTGRPCVSVSTHRTSVAVHQYTYQHTGPWTQHAGPSRGRTSVGVHLYTHDICGCPCVSVCVRVCPCVSVCTHMMYVAVHQYTYQHVGRWTQHANPSRGLVGQHTQDVCGCPSAHTGRPCVSVSTHRTFGAVRVCLCVSVSTHRTFVAVHQYTYKHVVHTGCPWVSASTHWTSVAVRVCPSVTVSTHRRSVSVHQFTFQHVVHKGRLWESASTHRTSVAVRQHTQVVRDCPCVSVSTHRMSVGVRQHTQDVRVCPSAHTGRPWLSMCVRVCPSAHTGRLWLSISTQISIFVLGLSTLALPVDCFGDFGPRGLSVQYTKDVCGCPQAHTGRPWVSVAICQHTEDVRGCHHTQRTSVGVHQHTQDVRGCPSAHTGRPCVSVCVCVCPSAHIGRPWLSISTHISTLVLGLSTLALPVDCLGDFGPRWLSVQYTKDVRGCPPAHIGRPWLSVAVRQHTQDVRDCPCVSVCVRQHTQDVRGCPSAHTGRPCVSVSTHRTSVAVHVCPFVSVSTHMTSLAYTKDVCGCPQAHTGRPWVSVAIRQHIEDVCGLHTGCPWVSASTHRTSVAVRVCPSVTVSTHRASVSVHQFTFQHYTQDVCGCPLGHTGRLWLSVCVRVCLWVSASTHRTFVAVNGCPTHRTCVCVCVCPWLSFSTHISTVVLGLSTLALSVDCLGDFGPRGLSVQYTHDVRGCPSAHTGRPWLSVCVCVFPSAHTGRPWLSISTHISTLVLRLSTLTLPVDSSGDFGPRGLSVEYSQDVCGCPPAHTGCPWLPVCVIVCPSVSVSTHRTSVAVHKYTYQHVVHTGRPWVSASTHRTFVAVSGCPSAHTGRLWLSVCARVCLWVSASIHRTFVAVRGCLSAHIGRPCVSVSTHRTSVCVRVCPSAHTGCPWLSISTHISTLALPVDCSGDFGPRGLSVQYTKDVRGCPSAHKTSVGVRQHTQDVRVCLCVSVSTHRTSYTKDVSGCPPAHTGHLWLSVSTHRTSVTVRVCLCVSISTHRTSVGVRQHTQDVRVCPSAHTGRPWLSMCVRVCPSAHTGRPEAGGVEAQESTAC
ncbi:hypothetical protein YC2023_108588 [Brassica napus]